jgi:hypothetical protein
VDNETKQIELIDDTVFAEPTQMYQIRFPNKDINVRVKNLKTVFINSEDSTSIKYINGLSFACWTPDIIEGEDINIINSSYTLEPFQFAELAQSANLVDHIKVITESATRTNQIEY